MTTSLHSSSSSCFLGLNNSIQKVLECLRTHWVCTSYLSTQGPVSQFLLSCLYAAHLLIHILFSPCVYSYSESSSTSSTTHLANTCSPKPRFSLINNKTLDNKKIVRKQLKFILNSCYDMSKIQYLVSLRSYNSKNPVK